jgi:hypothetical protein
LSRQLLSPAVWRVFAWTGIATICVLSVLPGADRPHTGAPGQIEHMAAYALTAAACRLGYRDRWGFQLAALAALSGVLEIVQAAIPGRHPAALDALASTLGAALGGAAVALVMARIGKRKPPR